MKFAYIDIETTGVELGKSEIISIALILENSETEKIAEFSWNVRPFNYKDKSIYNDEALEKNKMSIDEISNFDEPKVVYDKIIKILDKSVNRFDKTDKLFFIGYNCKFDYDFLRWWFEKNGNKYFGSYFWFPPIDICQMAMLSIMEVRSKFKDFKLNTVCEAFNIIVDEEKTHNSLYDIQISRELFKKIIKNC